mmetsp:Transcript_1603/g.2162  ORF Transcript_1603/g.2162 Transcript_1603/m.2162 type:complete len:175 (+) Transcript_1603:226-750(+)
MSAAPTETPTAKPILIAEKTQSPVEESASFYHPHTHDSHYRPPKVEEKENLPRPIFLKSEDMEVATNETRAHNSAAVAIYGEGHVIKNAPNSAAMAIYGEDYAHHEGGRQICPNCGADVGHSTSVPKPQAHFWAACLGCLCLFTAIPCCCIPYCLPSCYETKCKECGHNLPADL